MRVLSRLIVLVFGWLASDPESSDEHENVAGFRCQGITPEGDPCWLCDECEHPICRHLRNGTCLDCDRDDGVCRS